MKQITDHPVSSTLEIFSEDWKDAHRLSNEIQKVIDFLKEKAKEAGDGKLNEQGKPDFRRLNAFEGKERVE